jgi:pyruvate formate lyase activating enzyme
MGYAVKLDTNGSRPEILRRLLHARLLDYVAMDCKALFEAYVPDLSPVDVAAELRESRALLRESGIEHEFRVTFAAPLICADTFSGMFGDLEGAAPVFLQPARLGTVLRPEYFSGKGRALEAHEMQALKELAEARGVRCEIR